VVECEYKALNSNPRYKKERLREKEKKEGKEKKRRRKEGRKEGNHCSILQALQGTSVGLGD
jgi:hypothetical protein